MNTNKILLAISAALAAVGGFELLPGKWAFVCLVGSLFLAATNRALVKYTENKAVTVLGVIVFGAGAVAPVFLASFPAVGKILMLVGIVGAIFGDNLFGVKIADDTPPPSNFSGKILSILLVACLSAYGVVLSGCDKEQVATVQRQIVLNVNRASSEIGNGVVAVNALRQAGLISPDGALGALDKIAAVNAGNKHLIETLNKNMVVQEDGTKKLILSADVQKAVDDLAGIVQSALDDPVISKGGNPLLPGVITAFKAALKSLLQLQKVIRSQPGVSISLT